jgi:hypothetical protein
MSVRGVSATDGVHEILAALEALGVRVTLLDDDRIALSGAEAPVELRRALMRNGTAARAILTERRDVRDVAANTAHLRLPGLQATPHACADHTGFRDKPCRRCGRSWGAHYPWVKTPLPSLQSLRSKRVEDVRGKGAAGKQKPERARMPG